MKKTLSLLLSAAVLATSFSSGASAAPLGGASLSHRPNADIVQVRDRGGAVAAGAAIGLLGGLMVGSAIANSNSNRSYSSGYVCDDWGDCYPTRRAVPRRVVRYDDYDDYGTTVVYRSRPRTVVVEEPAYIYRQRPAYRHRHRIEQPQNFQTYDRHGNVIYRY